VGAVALVAAALVPSTAAAEGTAPCPVGEGAWLRVSFAGDGFAPPLQAQVSEQLGADLRAHRVALCDAASAPATPAPLAGVDLTLSPARVLSIEVSDAVTDKRMTRQIRLASVPRDALGLSIALAAEELLHASWIEAALVPQESPAPAAVSQPVPAAVREMNEEQVARIAALETRRPVGERPEGRGEGSTWLQASLLAAIDRATGGQTDLGGDLRLAMGGRFAFEGELGLRAAPDVQSAHGTVQGRELIAGAGVSFAFMPRRDPWGLQLAARADVVGVSFSAVAAAGARASSGSQLGATAAGSLGVWWRLGGPWRLLAEGTAGGVLRAVTATDAGNASTGVSGAIFGAALGVGATFSE
jgi:hypothetical protein